MSHGTRQEEQAILDLLESRALDAEHEAWQLRQILPFEPTREEQAEYRQMLDRDELDWGSLNSGRQQYEDETGCTCVVPAQEWGEMRMMRPSCPIHDKGRG